jgi:hypothetical protein
MGQELSGVTRSLFDELGPFQSLAFLKTGHSDRKSESGHSESKPNENVFLN